MPTLTINQRLDVVERLLAAHDNGDEEALRDAVQAIVDLLRDQMGEP